ncbi:MAG: hypothetical protein ACRDXC_07650, partial [Acidimicrobiales bacterium]
MERTTIMTANETMDRLRRMAQERRMSLAAVVREALDEKVEGYRPRPRSLGAGASASSVAASEDGTRRPPRSW